MSRAISETRAPADNVERSRVRLAGQIASASQLGQRLPELLGRFVGRWFLALAMQTWARAEVESLARALGQLLHEPPARARSLARACLQRGLQSSRMIMRVRSRSELRRLQVAIAQAEIEDERGFSHWSRVTGYRPLVFATLHMGPHILSAAIARRCRPEVACDIVVGESQKRWRHGLAKLWAAFGLPVDYLPAGRGEPGAAAAAHRKLRAGHDVAVYFDLAGQFGKTEAACFFGHPAHFVVGPLTIAARGGALVVPTATVVEGKRIRLLLGAPIDPAPARGESRRSALQRAQGELVRTAEAWIRRYPDQWLHWTMLPSLFAATRPEAVDLSPAPERT